MINKIKKIIKMPKTKRKAQLLPGICIMLLLCCTGCAQKKSGAVSGYADAKNGVAVVCEYVTLNGMEEGVAYGSGFSVFWRRTTIVLHRRRRKFICAKEFCARLF